MRVLIQRVSKASVEVDGEIISKINRGLLLFVGVTHEDDLGIAALDLNLEALVVSQFTLYGNTSKGRRPGFDQSAPPEKAEAIYQAFIESLENTGLRCASGKFRAEMKVNLINDGPVTYLLEKEKKEN